MKKAQRLKMVTTSLNRTADSIYQSNVNKEDKQLEAFKYHHTEDNRATRKAEYEPANTAIIK